MSFGRFLPRSGLGVYSIHRGCVNLKVQYVVVEYRPKTECQQTRRFVEPSREQLPVGLEKACEFDPGSPKKTGRLQVLDDGRSEFARLELRRALHLTVKIVGDPLLLNRICQCGNNSFADLT